MLELGLPDEERPGVVKTVATKGKGMDGLMAELERRISARDRSSQEARRKKLLSWMLRDVMREKIDRLISLDIPESVFAGFIDRIYHHQTDPYSVADELISLLKEKR